MNQEDVLTASAKTGLTAHSPTKAELADNSKEAAGSPSRGTDEQARRSSKREALAGLLRDGRWHSNSELLAVAGTAFGARVDELRRAGWEIEAEPVRQGEWRYLATRTSGTKPPQHVLGKQAWQAVGHVLVIVGEELGEDAFDQIFDLLPPLWREELLPGTESP